MPRLIRHEALASYKIHPDQFPRDEQGNLKHISICACGLSQNLPFCDNSHRQARIDEPPGKLCIYDRERRTIIEQRDDV